MQPDKHTFNRFQVRSIKQSSRNFHRIDFRTRRKGKSEITQRITFIIVDDSIRKVDCISGIRLQRVKQIHLYPLAGSLYFRLLYLRRGNNHLFSRLFQFYKFVKHQRDFSPLII